MNGKIRIYLFRGKEKESGEWVYGSYIAHERNIEWVEDVSEDGTILFGEGTAVIPETVGQYTELFDSNDKQIFEGDIVAVPCDRRGNEYIGVVEFGEIPNGDDRYTGFYIKWDNPDIVGSVRCSLLWWRDTKDRYLKVIGNKWDNPELLKGGAV